MKACKVTLSLKLTDEQRRAIAYEMRPGSTPHNIKPATVRETRQFAKRMVHEEIAFVVAAYLHAQENT